MHEGAHKGQKAGLDCHLELEMQTIVSPLLYVLRTEALSFGREVGVLNH